MENNFKLNNSTESPENINYDTKGYQKKRTFNNKGELIIVEYYKNFDIMTQTFSDLVIKENREYLRVDGWVYLRQMNIEFYLSDGSIGCKKNTIKYYDDLSSYQEGKDRKNNIINQISMFVLSQIGESNAKDFLNECASLIDIYIKGNPTLLLEYVSNSEQEYMLIGSPILKEQVYTLLLEGV